MLIRQQWLAFYLTSSQDPSHYKQITSGGIMVITVTSPVSVRIPCQDSIIWLLPCSTSTACWIYVVAVVPYLEFAANAHFTLFIYFAVLAIAVRASTYTAMIPRLPNFCCTYTHGSASLCANLGISVDHPEQ